MSEELPRWLDGPKFIAFLLSEGIVKSEQSDATIRRWTDWERGGRADRYGAADKVMTENLISERFIPDDCWAREQDYCRKLSPATRSRQEKGLGMLEQGMSPKEIARELGVHPRSINRWRRTLTTQVD
jgi:hypothetical protein